MWFDACVFLYTVIFILFFLHKQCQIKICYTLNQRGTGFHLSAKSRSSPNGTESEDRYRKPSFFFFTWLTNLLHLWFAPMIRFSS